MLSKRIGRLRRKFRSWNRILDNSTEPIDFGSIAVEEKTIISAKGSEIKAWLYAGGLNKFTHGYLHKKGLEFFFSSKLLDVAHSDAVLDAAGGRSGYIEAIRINHAPKELLLTDHIYSGIVKLEDGVTVVGGDISRMDIEDKKIDKIACHHAFEHFQSDKDTLFIRKR